MNVYVRKWLSNCILRFSDPRDPKIALDSYALPSHREVLGFSEEGPVDVLSIFAHEIDIAEKMMGTEQE